MLTLHFAVRGAAAEAHGGDAFRGCCTQEGIRSVRCEAARGAAAGGREVDADGIDVGARPQKLTKSIYHC